MDKPVIEYMKVPLHKYTFKFKPLKEWVENNCEGLTLNLFAGETKLNCNEIRIDSDPSKLSDFNMDAIDFITKYKDKYKFNTIILDPPYGLRKSMEMYNGNKISIGGRFNFLKDNLSQILAPKGIVITFGYHSVSMGNGRGYDQEKILLMSHGGTIHDTLATIERRR